MPASRTFATFGPFTLLFLFSDSLLTPNPIVLTGFTNAWGVFQVRLQSKVPSQRNLADGLLSRSTLRSTTRLKGCRASLRPACTSLSPNRSLSARLIRGCLRNRRAWVGSLQYCLIFVPSVVLGRAMDVGIFIVPFTCGCIFYGEFLRSACAVEH